MTLGPFAKRLASPPPPESEPEGLGLQHGRPKAKETIHLQEIRKGEVGRKEK